MWNAILSTARHSSIMMQSKVNSGTILAMMISDVLAGDMSSCSIVPVSRSLTIAAEATNELFIISKRLKTPVAMNQESIRPGL